MLLFAPAMWRELIQRGWEIDPVSVPDEAWTWRTASHGRLQNTLTFSNHFYEFRVNF
jgi:hypothetical protein